MYSVYLRIQAKISISGFLFFFTLYFGIQHLPQKCSIGQALKNADTVYPMDKKAWSILTDLQPFVTQQYLFHSLFQILIQSLSIRSARTQTEPTKENSNLTQKWLTAKCKGFSCLKKTDIHHCLKAHS